MDKWINKEIVDKWINKGLKDKWINKGLVEKMDSSSSSAFDVMTVLNPQAGGC